ncbi:MAG: arginine repressor [Planctomycetota bacterium]
MSRRTRHAIITELLGLGPIASQEALRQRLAERGIEVTQATLSRDLRDLGVVKGPRGYVMLSAVDTLAPGVLPDPELLHGPGGVSQVLKQTLTDMLVAVRLAGNLVVFKTAAGHAQVVAVEIDRRPPAGVLGTVAGDDTIFVACETPGKAAALAAFVSQQTGIGVNNTNQSSPTAAAANQPAHVATATSTIPAVD